MSPHTRGLLLLVVVTALWESTFAVVKELGETLPPSVLIAWRFLIATLALLSVLALTRRREIKHSTLSLWRDGLILGGWSGATYVGDEKMRGDRRTTQTGSLDFF